MEGSFSYSKTEGMLNGLDSLSLKCPLDWEGRGGGEKKFSGNLI